MRIGELPPSWPSLHRLNILTVRYPAHFVRVSVAAPASGSGTGSDYGRVVRAPSIAVVRLNGMVNFTLFLKFFVAELEPDPGAVAGAVTRIWN